MLPSLWFEGGCGSTELVRASTRTNQIVGRVDICERDVKGIRWIALGFGSVWVTTGSQHLLRIDPATNRIVGDLALPAGGSWGGIE